MNVKLLTFIQTNYYSYFSDHMQIWTCVVHDGLYLVCLRSWDMLRHISQYIKYCGMMRRKRRAARIRCERSLTRALNHCL